MADDKTKTGSPDRNLISFKEKYEFDYATKQLQSRFQIQRDRKQKTRSPKPRAKSARAKVERK